jgi:hypothetical protein
VKGRWKLLGRWFVRWALMANSILNSIATIPPNKSALTRREGAQRVYQDEGAFFRQYGEKACQILEAILEKYAEHGYT